MNVRSWINGAPESHVPADDRGLQYGDGVFETMAVLEGRIALLDFHLQRLDESCSRLAIKLPSISLIRDELQASACNLQRAILKLIITRGQGGRGYAPATSTEPTRILTLHDWPEYPANWWQDGIRARICSTTLGTNPALAGMKHLNRLEQVLARTEWHDTSEIQEGLMTDSGGLIIEGTMTNIFARLADGQWVTPDLRTCGVAGVMRRYILERCEREHLPVKIGRVGIADMHSVTEMFVCNSVIGVWPVRQLGNWKYKVGEMTRRIQQWVGDT